MAENSKKKINMDQIDIKVPNKVTADTLRKSEQCRELYSTSDVDELFTELDTPIE